MIRKPLDRAHQEKLAYFKQEMGIILDTLRLQNRVLGATQLLPSSIDTRPVVFPRHGQYLVPAPRQSHSHRSNYVPETSYAHVGPTISHREHSRSEYVERAERPVPSYEGLRVPGSQLDPTDPNGVQGILVRESQALIDLKMRGFYELMDRATELETWVTSSPISNHSKILTSNAIEYPKD